MNAYSYIRWSSAKQTDGDSFTRQTVTAKAISNANGWNLIDLPPDEGVSAFKGKNLSHKGILGQFIKKVESGMVPVPCALIIEKLDRFSRDEVQDVLPIFLNLIKMGVEVYSVKDNDHYSYDGIKNDPTLHLLKLILGFVAANSYSKTLGERVRSAKRNIRQQALSGKKIYMPDSCPSYLDFDKKINDYVTNKKSEIVKKVFSLYLEHHYISTVARILNKEKIKPLLYGKQWGYASVRALLRSRIVLGEFKGVKHYYPQIIDEKDFDKVQIIIHHNYLGKGKTSNLFNFLRGIIICKNCGMKVSQETFGGGKRRYFNCSQKKYDNTCKQHLTNANILEQVLFAVLLKCDPTELIQDTDKSLLLTIGSLEKENVDIDNQIQRLASLQDIGLDVLRVKLEGLKKRKDDIDKELQIKRSNIYSPDYIQQSTSKLKELIAGNNDYELDNAMRQMVDNLKNDEIRKKLREPIIAIIKKIILDGNKATIQIEYQSGKISDIIYVGN